MKITDSLSAELDVFQHEISKNVDALEQTPISPTLLSALEDFNNPPRSGALAEILDHCEFSDGSRGSSSEWLLLARSTLVLVDDTLHKLFSRTIPLAEEIKYWETVLIKKRWRAFYALQTSPVHLFQSSTRIIRDTRARVMDKGLTMGNLKAAITEHLLPHTSLVSLSDGMRQILFWNSIDIAIKQEIRSKISALEKLRDEQATAVGMIISSASFSRYETLERDVLNLVSTLRYIADAEPTSTSQPQSNHPVIDMGVTPTPQAIASIIGHLSSRLLHTQSKFREDSAQHSRPSKLTRWWPILIAGYFSSSTILQTVTNRREDILVWLSDALQTTRSFWQNWILEPIYQILAIIRHDKGSEVALISRRSLAADMDSLERMVVQFAQDNPQYANSSDTRVLQDAAREGDLTPVLRAYESNLKSPMRSVISGSLVRSLLIQIQKTKVDVEVAISGIDKLLKSQELVFGLLGISPAIAILWLLLRSFTTRKSSQSHFDNEEAKIEMIKILRRIDRDLCNDPHRESGLSYKTKGLVLCEVQLLKSQAKSIKLALQDSFLEDLHDMETECKSDAMKMQTILKRIHRSYLSN